LVSTLKNTRVKTTLLSIADVKLPNNPMISMHPGIVSLGQINRQIKNIKKAIDQPELYSAEEYVRLKQGYRNLLQQRRDLSKGNGFGN